MFGAELPTWHQLFGKIKKNVNSYWGESECIWTTQSGVSIKLILEKYKEYFKKDLIEFWIPSYFCIETESFFHTVGITIRYYPINKNLDPDWNTIKEMSKEYKPDIFLFVHYFGVYHDINSARVFCDRFHSILIEDCAHVLYNTGKFGEKADFTIYSPHKLLPVPDGAIIYYNKDKEDVSNIGANLEKEMNVSSKNLDCVFWRVKKFVQKIIKYRKNTHFKVGIHIGALDDVSQKKVQVSKWSYDILKEYSYEKLKMISYIRRTNLKTMNYIVKQISEDIIPVITDDVVCPYVAVYSLEKIQNKQEVVNELENRGLLVSYWPTISAKMQDDVMVRWLSENYIVIPIHQGMDSQYLLKKYSQYKTRGTIKFSLKPFDNIENKELWDKLCTRNINIPQDWIYGDIKVFVEGGDIKRFGIYNEGEECIGLVQVLIKSKMGIPFMIRINRGPLLVEEYDTVENIIEIMGLLKKILHIPVPYFWAPNIVFSPENMEVIVRDRWKCWKKFGFPSGVIDIQRNEDEIRKQFNSKWRNQLKSAEKNDLVIQNDNSLYRKLLDIYLKDQREKNYQGIPDKILEELFKKDGTPLITYYILNDKKEPIAFDIIYRQNQYAHYLVGWNSDEGRKKNLNNLLLYHALIDLKTKGICMFDLGGIDYIYTEDIAKFKDGMNPEHYQLLGEFIKWF